MNWFCPLLAFPGIITNSEQVLIPTNASFSSLVSAPAAGHSYWLMKAEPDSRIEKGKDVKFSIDDLQAASAPEPW